MAMNINTNMSKNLKAFAHLIRLVNDEDSKELAPSKLPPIEGAGIEPLGKMNHPEKQCVLLIDYCREAQRKILITVWGKDQEGFDALHNTIKKTELVLINKLSRRFPGKLGQRCSVLIHSDLSTTFSFGAYNDYPKSIFKLVFETPAPAMIPAIYQPAK